MACEVRLISRGAIPTAMRADSDDYRRLGLAVSRIVLGGRVIPLADARLGAGWRAVEPDGAHFPKCFVAAWRASPSSALESVRLTCYGKFVIL
jgi:hypothetical protein